jgi:peptide/nickel transport system substrate-binding protein
MKKKFITLCAVLMAIALLATACAPATQTPAVTAAAPANTTVPVNTTVPATATTEPTAVPTEPPSLVGGTMIEQLVSDPATIDPQQSGFYQVTFNIYSSLITLDEAGNYQPYLATSWEISPDGLTYTFHLRQDVKFHNGDPMTAQDVVWTYQREEDPATASPIASYLESMDTIQALDDYTVQMTLKSPNYYLFRNLANEGFQGILDPEVVQQAGDNYGRNPIGTGPFIFKEWVTGDHIILERNPDFVWGPPITNGQPPNIQTIEYRIIPDPSTVIAGLEAGEIDYVEGGTSLLPSDTNNLGATGMFDIVQRPNQGMDPYVTFNTEKAPFNDIRVRQALNYATNKQALMDIMVPNSGSVIQNGPLSASQEGYWPGIEQVGYPYDLEKAKQLMQEAGYTYNADGMLEKDGQPLSFELILLNGMDMYVKPGEILQSQWKELGVDVQLSQQELGVAWEAISPGNYSASLMGFSVPTSEQLVQMFRSNYIDGGFNMSRVNNPDLDALLDTMVTAVDPAVHLQAAQDAQKLIVEQAYILPLFCQVPSEVISKRLKNYNLDLNFSSGIRFWNAYLEP